MSIPKYCRSCDTDFASVAAFDRHRTGTHDYTFQEGLRLESPVEDGRRCLHPEEMLGHGMEVDRRGRWRIAVTEADKARLAALGGGSATALGATA
jgi:hypothetical protein